MRNTLESHCSQLLQEIRPVFFIASDLEIQNVLISIVVDERYTGIKNII